jgi:hypothetical protein
MDNEIQLISDGDGLAVIGNATDVERFLMTEGIPSKPLGLDGLGPAMSAAAGAAKVGSEIAANSGRWVKLTKDSAELVEKYGMTESTKTGFQTGVVRLKNGQIKEHLQFVKSSRSILTNPALLSGAAGIMSQLAMQEAMDNITDYLATIDEKVDELLRAQKDAVLSDMIGVDLMIDEVMTVRAEVGRVSDVTWSKVQGTSTTIARTQGYALRQLDALADKVERKANIGELAKAAAEVQSKVQEWLAVLARCFQLQDALSILELDRVLDATPHELDQHRVGLNAARRNRLDLIARSTERLMDRMDVAANAANSKVLLHPTSSRTVVGSSIHVVRSVVDFQSRLGIDRDRENLTAKRWLTAVADVRDKVLETGVDGVTATARVGKETIERAQSMTDEVSIRIAGGALRRREGKERARGAAVDDSKH